jgi:biotin operon repressor
MNSYFFRVEHDLLRSEAFKTLGGSAIKVYLVIGLYSDFGTDWAYPSIRTIARQAGLSRQTVLAAIEKLAAMGLLATNKSKGRSTAYRIIRQAPERPSRSRSPKSSVVDPKTGLKFLDVEPESGPETLEVPPGSGRKNGLAEAQFAGVAGRPIRPKQEPASKTDTTPADTTSIPLPGTPFRVTADGRLLVAVDLQELLTNQGIPGQLARKLIAQKDPEAVAKVLLNALYLQSEGKLQNGPGYIRAGIEDGYDLLPQVASRLENRRRELENQLQQLEIQERQTREAEAQAAEQSAINYVLTQLRPEELSQLLAQAIDLLPEPITRRNPTLSNPFVRGKIYELACGKPEE